jgi:hypothetical protein
MQEDKDSPQNGPAPAEEETIRPPEAFAALLDRVLAGLPAAEAEPELPPGPPPPIPAVLTADDLPLHDRRHPSMLERLFGRRRTGHGGPSQTGPLHVHPEEGDGGDHLPRDEQSAALLRQVQTIWRNQESRPAEPEVTAPSADAATPPDAVPAAVQDADGLLRRIAAATPNGVGTADLPQRQDALDALLAFPSDDFVAQDLLRACWPQRGPVASRAALAVALTLTQGFGRSGRLPLASAQAWRLLDPNVFREALSRQLATISDFVLIGQKPTAPALSLEHGEIDLIEYLFETLEPGENPDLLASVMAFKGLSGRRFGLVRRIPTRARHRIEALDPAMRSAALPGLFQSRALLLRLSDHGSFPPLAEAALRALTEIEALIERVAEDAQQ